jgi:glycosyltransferase involved in cell wall biosynthesis
MSTVQGTSREAREEEVMATRDLTYAAERAQPASPSNGLTLAGPRVSVVIPTLNEAENLPYVFARLPEDIYEVILVDGRSVDNTVEVARLLYPKVRMTEQSGRGKGNALCCGFADCSADIVVTLDADGSADPAEIPRFVEALCQGADFAKGSRFLPGGGTADLTALRRLGNYALGQLVNVLYRTRFTDLCYGYNAFWASCLPYMNVDCSGFEVETLMHVRVAKAGLKVVEVPSYEALRRHGESHLSTFRDGWRVLTVILSERFAGPRAARTRRPHRIGAAQRVTHRQRHRSIARSRRRVLAVSKPPSRQRRRGTVRARRLSGRRGRAG